MCFDKDFIKATGSFFQVWRTLPTPYATRAPKGWRPNIEGQRVKKACGDERRSANADTVLKQTRLEQTRTVSRSILGY